jgi:hypothetical protein
MREENLSFSKYTLNYKYLLLQWNGGDVPTQLDKDQKQFEHNTDYDIWR